MGMHNFIRFGVPLLAATHVCLLAWQYIPEIGVCKHMRLPSSLRVTDDLDMVFLRNTHADAFNLVSVFELVVMCMTAVQLQYQPKVLRSFKVLPFLLMISTLVVRLRHMGPLGCAKDDKHCCGNLGCPDSDFTMELSGCMSAYTESKYGYLPIEWSRTSFCTIPCWYSELSAQTNPDNLQCKNVAGNVRDNCGGLYGTPDVASCYRYGCSVKASPIPYYGLRLLTANVIVFVCLSLAAQIST